MMRSIVWKSRIVVFFSVAGMFMAFFSQLADARPVTRLIVGFPPGGTTDAAARVIAEPLSNLLGTPVIVDNKPGAGGAIAALALKSASADGNTIMLASIASISLYPSVTKPVKYDPFKDMEAIGLVGRYDLALAVSEASGIKSLSDYINWLKKNPEKASFGSPGTGTLPHLFGLQLARANGVEIIHVPFQGASPSLVNLLGGQVSSVIQPISDLISMRQAKRIRVLATTGSKRNSEMPDVPTFKELGYSGMEGGGWIGLFAPAKTPQASVQSIWRALESVVSDPVAVSRMKALGFDVAPMSREAFSQLTRDDAKKWGAVVKNDKNFLSNLQ